MNYPIKLVRGNEEAHIFADTIEYLVNGRVVESEPVRKANMELTQSERVQGHINCLILRGYRHE